MREPFPKQDGLETPLLFHDPADRQSTRVHPSTLDHV